MNKSSALMLALFELMTLFTNTHKKKKYGFFSSEATFPAEFQFSDQVKKIFDVVFEKLCDPQFSDADLFLKNLLEKNSPFLSTSYPKEYLREYCLEKMKTNDRFYQDSLGNDKPLGKLIDARRDRKVESTATRKFLQRKLTSSRDHQALTIR